MVVTVKNDTGATGMANRPIPLWYELKASVSEYLYRHYVYSAIVH